MNIRHEHVRKDVGGGGGVAGSQSEQVWGERNDIHKVLALVFQDQR